MRLRVRHGKRCAAPPREPWSSRQVTPFPEREASRGKCSGAFPWSVAAVPGSSPIAASSPTGSRSSASGPRSGLFSRRGPAPPRGGPGGGGGAPRGGAPPGPPPSSPLPAGRCACLRRRADGSGCGSLRKPLAGDHGAQAQERGEPRPGCPGALLRRRPGHGTDLGPLSGRAGTCRDRRGIGLDPAVPDVHRDPDRGQSRSRAGRPPGRGGVCGGAAWFPLGIALPEDQWLIRNVLAIEGTSLRLGADLPAGTEVRVMAASTNGLQHATQDAAVTALKRLEGQAPSAVLVVEGAARRAVQNGSGRREWEMIREQVPAGTPLLGWLTASELVPGGSGPVTLQNATVTVIAFP